MSDIGFSLCRNEIFYVLNNYLLESEQFDVFKDCQPSNNWYYGFLKRHRQKLAIRSANMMPSNKAKASNSDEWFSTVKAVYEQHDFHTKPHHVFNCDESGMQCDLGKFKVISRKGTNSPKRLANNNQKKCLLY